MFPKCNKRMGESPSGDGGIQTDYCDGSLVPVKIQGLDAISFSIIWKCTECGRGLDVR